MIDPTTIRLNEALYRERLQAAAQAQQQKATWVVAPGMLDRLQMAIGRRLIAVGQQLQTHATPSRVNS